MPVCNFLLKNNNKCKNRTKGKNIACYKHIFYFLDYDIFNIELDIFTYEINIDTNIFKNYNNNTNISENINLHKLNEYKKDELIKIILNLNLHIDNYKQENNILQDLIKSSNISNKIKNKNKIKYIFIYIYSRIKNKKIKHIYTNDISKIYYHEFIVVACHFCKVLFKIETRTYDLIRDSGNFYCHKCFLNKIHKN